MSSMSAIFGLLSRYVSVWRTSWKQRKLFESPNKLQHETQFLPSALALQEQPVSVAPRYIQLVIVAFSVLALIWACFGEVDVVATSPGKVIAIGNSKTIQPSETAVVKAIRVYDGQMVKAGQPLVELDSGSTSAEVARITGDLVAAQIDAARARALLNAIAGNNAPTLVNPTSTNRKEWEAALRWVTGQYQEFHASGEQINAEIDQRTAEIQSGAATLASLRKSLPITQRLADDYHDLAEQQYVPRHAYLEKQQALLDVEKNIAVQISRDGELKAAKRESERRRDSLVAQSSREMLDLEQQSLQKIASTSQELIKAQQRDNFMSLAAPVDGTVQQLSIHTVGGVVTAAQPLMVIVPINMTVEVEAMLDNKDIGFVRAGQAVTVKVETFTFTKYGTIEGEVTSVSDDAIEDEKRGPIYSVRIKLHKTSIHANQKDVALSPGMAVTAEIKTDRRKIIDYVLSPLEQYVDESFRER